MMSPPPSRQCHVARWPALAWLETLIKLLALGVGIAAGGQALASGGFSLPGGWRLLPFGILLLLSLGLVAAIADRWTERELIAMGFVLINNLGHWGMLLSLSAPPFPERALLLFAGLMLLGDLVKLLFIRAHQFTVRDYGPAVLMRLTAVYAAGYTLLILTARLG